MTKHLTPVPDVPADGAQEDTEASPQPSVDPATHPIEHAVRDLKYLDVLKAQQRDIAIMLDEGAGAQTAQLHRTLTALTKEIKEHEDLIGVTSRPRTPDEKFEAV